MARSSRPHTHRDIRYTTYIHIYIHHAATGTRQVQGILSIPPSLPAGTTPESPGNFGNLGCLLLDDNQLAFLVRIVHDDL